MTETQESKSTRPQNKRLEGVQSTDELRQVIRDARTIVVAEPQESKNNDNANKAHSTLPPLSTAQAMEILRNFDTTSRAVPIKVLRAAETVCTAAKNRQQGVDCQKRLDKCLCATQLAFTPPCHEPETQERKKFRLRMERLKLKQEENRYGGLVKNVGVQGQPDDVTTRSMTYAASIGLNMIVAPLSFGCFMYFFAGGLFHYLGWDNNRPAHLGPDIRKVRQAKASTNSHY